MRTTSGIGIVAMMTLGVALPVAAQQACVRVAHLSPGAPAVDVQFNDDTLFEGLTFPSYGDYVDLAPGGYVMEITPAGDPDTVLLGMALRVGPDRSYTVAAVGLPPELLDVLIFDDFTSPLPPGFAASRVINVSPDAPVVDIVAPDGRVLLDDLMGGTASEYAQLPAGEYPVQVRNQSGEILESRTIVLNAGEVTSGTGAGLFAGDPPVQLLPVLDFPNDCSLNHQRVDYSGMWFDPAQNGQGVQLVQNGDLLEGAWYVYDDGGMATFYTFSGMLDGDGDFSGDLLAWTGPALGAVWDTSQLNFTDVGSVDIDFGTTVYQADLDWSVDDGPGGTLNLVPYIPTPAM